MSPLLADSVAKVPKAAAAKFSPKNETSDNRRSIEPQTRCQNLACGDVVPTSLFNRRAHASENLRPMPQKDFCNTICQQRTLFPCLNGLEHPSAPSALLLCNLQGSVRKRAGIASQCRNIERLRPAV